LIVISNITQVLATDYFVDNLAGGDFNEGSFDQPWKTLKVVNNFAFNPGDRVFLKRGQIWRESLIISNSGTTDNKIEFGAYGKGSNPQINRTELFDDWKLIKSFGEDNTKAKIWQGKVEGIRNYWGAVVNRKRLPQYPQKKMAIINIKEGYFYSPPDSELFYLRSDTGMPGEIEVGTRKYGVSIKNVNNIVISDIDVTGPGGGKKQAGRINGLIEIHEGSRNIRIMNLSLTNSDKFGIWSDSSTQNIEYHGITAFKNRSTGIYNNATGGGVIGSSSYDNGLLVSDTGDKGGIGIQGSELLIKDNNVYNNGHLSFDADYEISIAVARGPITVKNNYIRDCGQGCFQIAEGGDGSLFENNVINGFGTSTAKPSSVGKFSGIRIGGGIGGAKNVKIKGNKVTNGSKIGGYSAISILGFDSSGLEVIKNTLVNNNTDYIFIHRKAVLDNININENTYFSRRSNKWNYKGKVINTLEQWKKSTGLDLDSEIREPELNIR